jgi:peptidase E
MANNNKLTNNLILIGGGIMRKGETEKIDRWILKKVRSQKKTENPKVLFIPSASDDLKEYVQDFTNRYQEYGAMVDSLFLIKETPSRMKIKKKLLNADLIYFGGGSAELLLKTFKKFELEPICVQAVKNGTFISGLSAGAIIWGKKFLTFDRRGNKFVNFRIKNGLGWIDNLVIPHFNPSMLKNKKVSNRLKSNLNLEALAIGNGTAAFWEDKPIPLFKKQKKSCLGLSLLAKDLIQKYE